MSGTPSALPLGAVRTDDGSVVVPESRRADGSVRKPIRIRQGYVPQDEVAKYKPIGQRLREQKANAKERPVAQRESPEAVADALGALSLATASSKSQSMQKRDQPLQSLERKNQHQTSPASTVIAAQTTAAKALKSELSTVNKTLREIVKLEAFAAASTRGDDGARPLTAVQTRKVERKADLEMRRRDIIDALDGDKATPKTATETKPSQTLRVIEM